MKHSLWRILTTPFNHMHALLLALVCLVIADGLTTQSLIETGLGQEGNTLMQPIVDQRHFALLKAVGAFACALVLWDIYRRHVKLALFTTSLLVTGYLAVVVWNLSIYFRL